jgi:hypothetical protein
VNGALGYGFSSITDPLALFVPDQSGYFNPALEPIEVQLNAYVLWVNRASLPKVWRRTLPIVIGLLPGVIVGHGDRVEGQPRLAEVRDLPGAAAADSAAGGRLSPADQSRSDQSGWDLASASGSSTQVTTISGPPLAVMLSNQGFTKRDFRAALGFIRLAEVLFHGGSRTGGPVCTPSKPEPHPLHRSKHRRSGVPIGAVIIQRVRPETFRRICMSFDAWIVGFGLSNLLKDLHLVESNLAFLLLRGGGVPRRVAALSLLLGAAADRQARRGHGHP